MTDQIKKETAKERKAKNLATYQFQLSNPNATGGRNRYRILVANGYDALIIRVFEGNTQVKAIAMDFTSLVEKVLMMGESNPETALYEDYRHYVE